nr:NIPSNAP family protein [Amycolatopsis kentuckyensis]
MTFTEFETVVELRRYTLHPGRRDELVELFEREFVEPQEAAGAHLFGLFRARASPDEFVWLRGFRSMSERKAALEEFYSGPVWKEHRSAANATMIDSDNVLLLRPVRLGLASPPPGTGCT